MKLQGQHDRIIKSLETKCTYAVQKSKIYILQYMLSFTGYGAWFTAALYYAGGYMLETESLA